MILQDKILKMNVNNMIRKCCTNCLPVSGLVSLLSTFKQKMANANQIYCTTYCEGMEKLKMPYGEYLWFRPRLAEEIRAAIWKGLDPYKIFGIPKPNIPQNKIYCKYIRYCSIKI